MRILLQWVIFAFWIERCLGADCIAAYPARAEIPPVLTKAGEWEPVSAPADSLRPGFPLASTAKGRFTVFFHGSGFSFTISRPPGSSISVWVDGKRPTTPFVPQNESTNAIDHNMNIELPNMSTLDVETEVDNHRLVVDITASEDDPVILDRVQVFTKDLTYILYNDAASSSGVWTLIDDDDERVTYSNLGWQQARQPFFVNGTVSVTSTPGAWFQLTFAGSGIWVVGAIPVEGTVFSVEVKKYGCEVTRSITTHNVTRPGSAIELYQTNLFVEKDLTNKIAYSFNFTLISGTMMIDFIGVDGVFGPAGAGDIWIVSMPPSSVTPNLKIIIPSALCALVFAVLVGVASFLLYNRYHLRRPYCLGLGINILERRKEEITQSFREAYTQPSNINESKPSKGSTFRIRDANYQRHCPPSSSSTTISLNDSLASTHIISSDLGQSGFVDSESQEPSIRLPLGDYGTEDREPLSLSHVDLARVFGRAEKLRLGDDGGEINELEPQLETLARQLANRGQ